MGLQLSHGRDPVQAESLNDKRPSWSVLDPCFHHLSAVRFTPPEVNSNSPLSIRGWVWVFSEPQSLKFSITGQIHMEARSFQSVSGQIAAQQLHSESTAELRRYLNSPLNTETLLLLCWCCSYYSYRIIWIHALTHLNQCPASPLASIWTYPEHQQHLNPDSSQTRGYVSANRISYTISSLYH